MAFFFRKRREVRPKDIRLVFGDEFPCEPVSCKPAGSPQPAIDANLSDESVSPELLLRPSAVDASDSPITELSDFANGRPSGSSLTNSPSTSDTRSISLRRASPAAVESLQMRQHQLDTAFLQERAQDTEITRFGKSGRLFGLSNGPHTAESQFQLESFGRGITLEPACSSEEPSFDSQPGPTRSRSSAPTDSPRTTDKAARLGGLLGDESPRARGGRQFKSSRLGDFADLFRHAEPDSGKTGIHTAVEEYPHVQGDYSLQTPSGPKGTNTVFESKGTWLGNMSPGAGSRRARDGRPRKTNPQTKRTGLSGKLGRGLSGKISSGLSGKISSGLSGKISSGLSGKIPASLSGKLARRSTGTTALHQRQAAGRFGQGQNGQDVWSTTDAIDLTDERSETETRFTGDGYGRCRDADGSEYAGQFLNSEKHGIGQLKFRNGDSYKGEFAHGLRCGMGMTVFCNGDKHVGSYSDGAAFGFGSLTYEGATGGAVAKYTGGFLDGKKHGDGREESEDGRWVWKGTFVQGERAGGKYVLSDGRSLQDLPPGM